MSFTGSPGTGSGGDGGLRPAPDPGPPGARRQVSSSGAARGADLAAGPVPQIVRNFTSNAGQVYVAGTAAGGGPRGSGAQIVEAIAAEMEKVRVGHWYEDVDMGPLISQKQENRVMGYMDGSRPAGGRPGRRRRQQDGRLELSTRASLSSRPCSTT